MAKPSCSALAAGVGLALAAPLAAGGPALSFSERWTNRDGSYPASFAESAAEIVTHDAGSQRVFVVNGYASRVDVLDANTGARLGSLGVSGFGSPNSVATRNGKVAVAVQNTDPQAPGFVVFFDANDADISTGGTSTGSAAVGAMPDMVSFTPDGSRVPTANEGEPNWNSTMAMRRKLLSSDRLWPSASRTLTSIRKMSSRTWVTVLRSAAACDPPP